MSIEVVTMIGAVVGPETVNSTGFELQILPETGFGIDAEAGPKKQYNYHMAAIPYFQGRDTPRKKVPELDGAYLLTVKNKGYGMGKVMMMLTK